MTDAFLPYGRQQISEEDIDAVAEALRSELITQGPMIRRFEEAMADYLGARHVIALANGTAALHAAAFAAGIEPGDDVITTPLSFAASSNCLVYQGGRPRFVDIAPETLNLDTDAAARAVTEATRAVMTVSFAGRPIDLAPLAPVRNRAMVLEDASHALGGSRGGQKVGGPGGADVTTFSLHPVKAMTSGEGGLCATERDDLADRMRLFRTHGISKVGTSPSETDGDWYYEMQALGFNYRITDFQCALGMTQLSHLDDWIAARNEVADWYRSLLAEDERVSLPPEASRGDLHAYHLFVIQVLEGPKRRRRVFEALRAAGIGVQVHYIPIYRFPYYRDELGYPQDAWPATEKYYEGAISLPMFPALKRPDVERVVRELQSALA